ncbi:MAG: ferrochelatase [Pseudonocardiales bacterium]|nr:ferrochelatase [Pseudonocardiales bacterium]
MTSDALLLLSFGGPEGPSEVRPFLENVTRGRGVPPQRLAEVAQHYLHFGGVSPINQCNRTLITAIERALATAGLDLPVYFGNRNWHPMVEDTVAAMAADGVRNAVVFATSAWGGYSGCRQYHEDIARARYAVGPRAPDLMKLRHFFDHPLFVAACAEALCTAREQADPAARVVFTAHSVPLAADATAGLAAQGGHRYSRQVTTAAQLVATAAGVASYDVVWQSRSGPPQVPWLEPDVIEHLDALHAQGVPGVVVAPIGFVSDHLEVVWDLDHEARQRAATLGMDFVRAATPGTNPRFAAMVVELIAEQARGALARRCSQVPAAGQGVNGVPCAPSCCARVWPGSSG